MQQQTIRTTLLPVLVAILVAFTALNPLTTLAEDEEIGLANYAYSIFTGTGEYRIDDRTIYVFRAPLAWELQAADYKTRTFGYHLLVPFSVGITNFDDIEDLDDIPDFSIEDLQTITVAPGVQVVIPAARFWQIKPFAQLGYGADLQSDDNTVIWGVGVHTRYSFSEDSNWLIGGEFLRAGNNPRNDDTPSSRFSRLGLGTEYKVPTNWDVFGRRISWHGRLMQWYFSDKAEFLPPHEETKIRRSTEVGVSIGIDPPISIFGYRFTQGGIGYEIADGYEAITLFTTFPF